MTARRILLIVLLAVLPALAGASAAAAGADAASVPEGRIPWSGYWWPFELGELVNGYTDQPGPLKKYDAYVTGYYPAQATAEGLKQEYDPEASSWTGHCDDWAAAAVLEPEPARPGDLNGIPFAVGDKKGLLTAYYNRNFTAVMYGSRYREEGDDPDDIYPGGVNGFHQTLINYIAVQGLPIVVDLDAGPQVWSYPIYRYEMEWTDEGNTRHVTCTVWMADDLVTPDVVGTHPFIQTFTYALEIDGSGELVDAPGWWEGASIDFHPDFMWFPTRNGSNGSYLDTETVYEIIESQVTGSDDRFEPDSDPQTAYPIEELMKNRFYWASAQDEDWYRVSLEPGDDFYAFLLSPSDDLDVRIFDPAGREVGDTFYHGVQVDSVDSGGDYRIRVAPQAADSPYYTIEFFTSPSDVIPHIASSGGWSTAVTLMGEDPLFDRVRINLFGQHGDLIGQTAVIAPEAVPIRFSVGDLFPAAAESAKNAKIINLDANTPPNGFFSYGNGHQLANFPFGLEPAQTLFLPDIRNDPTWWTGLVLMNTDAGSRAEIDFSAYARDGRRVGEGSLAVEPGGSRADLVEAFGGIPEEAAWVAFSSDQKLQGLVLWGTEYGLAGIPLLREKHLGKTLLLPHLATYGGWQTEVTLLNPNPQSVRVTVSGYTAESVQAGESTVTIPANGRFRGAVETLFAGSWDPRFVWAKIQADRDVCGYQQFARGLDGLAALPLASDTDMKTEFWVKAVPDREAAWLGLVFLNTGKFKTDIWAAPYDEAGNPLLGQTYLWYNPPNGIGRNSNAVGLVESIFPGLPPQTAYMKIFSKTPILGFGIYENIPAGTVDVLYLD